eukprot:6364401-Prymnesium_polylepis.1
MESSGKGKRERRCRGDIVDIDFAAVPLAVIDDRRQVLAVLRRGDRIPGLRRPDGRVLRPRRARVGR